LPGGDSHFSSGFQVFCGKNLKTGIEGAIILKQVMDELPERDLIISGIAFQGYAYLPW